MGLRVGLRFSYEEDKRSFETYSNCFEIPEAEHASVASRCGCSRTKYIVLLVSV
ncbi:MAG: hypothetical protein LBJ00_03560 [Planctomycetaceae bacterium]|nr:hypothetical protein [Planctomycetaceae bacterium]